MDPNRPFDWMDFGTAFALVAVLASLQFIGAFLVYRPTKGELWPTWAHPPRAWNGFLIVLAFFASAALPSLAGMLAFKQGWYATHAPDEARTLCTIAVRSLTTPLFFGVLAYVYIQVLGPIRWPSARRFGIFIAMGAVCWLPLTLVTSGVHLLTIWVKQQLGGPIDVHPLAKMHPSQDGFGGALFGLAVCFMTPLVEEYFFRGLMLPWAARKGYRPWVLIAWSLYFAVQTIGDFEDPHYAAILFVGAMALILGGCQILPRAWPKRTILSIVSTSALFAAVHSAVWPSPIPLFVLALGLGFITARTGSIIPAVVVHGLFNFVSFLYLLRSPVT